VKWMKEESGVMKLKSFERVICVGENLVLDFLNYLEPVHEEILLQADKVEESYNCKFRMNERSSNTVQAVV